MPDREKIRRIKTGRPFKLWDIAVFGAVIVAVAALLIFSYSGKGGYVRVSYNGANSEYPLTADREINIDGKLKVVIKDGGVSVKDASCPDKVCQHSGVIKRNGQMIICAPHGVIISIVTAQTDWV